MKKVMSIILIAAAAFGFYGGAVNINDVLDCKAYWEEEGRKTDENLTKLQDGVDQLEENTDAYKDGKSQYAEGEAKLAQAKKDYAAAPGKLADAASQLAAAKIKLAKGEADLNDAYTLLAGISALSTAPSQWNVKYNELTNAATTSLKAGYPGLINILKGNGLLPLTWTGGNDKLYAELPAIIATIEPGKAAEPYKTLYEAVTGWKTGYEDLLDGAKYACGNYTKVLNALLSIDEVKAALEVMQKTKQISAEEVAVLKDMASTNSKTIAALTQGNDVFAIATAGIPQEAVPTGYGDYYGLLLKVNGVLEKAQPLIAQKTASGAKELAAGKQAYAAGQKEYKAGLASYKAAPAQIADGEAQLADAKKKLGEYEDGEKQLRDGLKTLMDTKAEGGLKSIAARIGENETFTTADGYVDFDAANKGVQAGRDYSSDSGDAITPELTNRGIASGVGLGAAALALIAAILGLAKKKKAAGILGILAAIGGGVALAMMKSAGDTWTVLAGSTIGTMPLIAFGVVAAAALIFAIVQFAGKEA